MELKRELCQSDRNEILNCLSQLDNFFDLNKDELGIHVNELMPYNRIKDIVSQPRHPQGTEGSFTGKSIQELSLLLDYAEDKVRDYCYARNNATPEETAKYANLASEYRLRADAIEQEIERRILALPTPQK